MLAFSIALYLLLTLILGYFASLKVKNTADFVVAGRSLPLFMAATVIFATWFGSETIVAAPVEFVEKGILGLIQDPFGAALCLFLVGFFYARKLYSLNLLTFCDYFKIRYGEKNELLSAILIIPSYFGWIGAQLVALKIIMGTVLGIDEYTGLIIGTALVTFYTYIGGMWAVSLTDFLQTFVIIGGLLAVLVGIFLEIEDVSTLLHTPADKPHFWNFTPEALTLESSMAYLAAWITIGLGSIPQQDVFQRVMAAKSPKTAVLSSHLGGLLYLTLGLVPVLIVWAGVQVYPELAQKGENLLPTLVLNHSPMPIQILFFGALLSAVMSTTSGAILAPASVLGENIIRHFKKDISDKYLLLTIRTSIIFVTLFSLAMAIWKPNIHELVAQSSIFSLVSLFVPLTAGLYWKKASPIGAFLSMCVGMGTWGIAEFAFASAAVPPMIWGLVGSAFAMWSGSLWEAARNK
jgi:SSS family transporter